MKVLFFAQSRQITGRDDYRMSVGQPVTEAEFWTALIASFPGLAVCRKTARLARHESYLQAGDLIQPGDEIAIIPPVSGG